MTVSDDMGRTLTVVTDMIQITISGSVVVWRGHGKHEICQIYSSGS